MYDHSVQGTNDLQPYSGVKLDGPNDAVVIRPFLDKKYGVVISHGLNPSYSYIDTYNMAAAAIDTAVRKDVAVGARPDRKNRSLRKHDVRGGARARCRRQDNSLQIAQTAGAALSPR